MKFCNYIIVNFFIICMLQNINLYAFQNTEKKTESFDLIKLDTASNTSENQVGEKSKSKKFIVQKRKKKQKDSLNIGMYKIFDYEGKSISVDTSLTIKKEYTNNLLRKDYFELLPLLIWGMHSINWVIIFLKKI